MSALEFGRERFRFTLHRDQRRLVALNIDPFVEHANWARSGTGRSGEINFRKPLTGLQAAAIAKGDRVRCEVDLYGTGRWRRLWELTVATPSHEITSGLISVALSTKLKALQVSKAEFAYRDKTARQITRLVARRFHVKIGRLPAAHHQISKLSRRSSSPADVLTAAWRHEREATGRRFDIDISRGLIDVVELREPKFSLQIDDLIMNATIEQALRSMASAIIVTSTRTVDGRRRKLEVKVVDRARLRRYGYIVRRVHKPGLRSAAAARRYGREQLARRFKPSDTITFTHPGLPFLDRGDAIRLRIPQANFDQPVFVTAVNHAVSAGSYVMDVTVSFTDPWVDVRKERAKAKRAAAARRRKRGGDHPAPAARKPAKAARRAGK